jgi:AraC-like DNA-binding protein
MLPSFQRALDWRISVRFLWPFLREDGLWSRIERVLKNEGIDLRDCVRSEMRISYRAAIRALEAYVRATGDVTVGLRAANRLEPGDLDVAEFTARCCGTLRDALLCIARYARLITERGEVALFEETDPALCRFGGGDADTRHFASNDFVLAAALNLLRRYVGIAATPPEVHFMHSDPHDAQAYARAFPTAVRFGMPHNGFVLHRSQLGLAMLPANAKLHSAFSAYARELLDHSETGLRRRVAELVAEELRAGNLTMRGVASRFGASAATLRRRLDNEGTTFREVVDEVRRALAERYLLDRTLSISEVGFALGFANVGAFNRAFRRWNSASPSEYRTQRLRRS